MKVSQIDILAFKSKIIDSHTHVGSLGNQTYTKSNLDVFVKDKLPNGDTVEKMFVSSSDVFNGTKNELDGNRDVLKNFHGDTHYEIFATCSPKDGDAKNIEKLYKENPNTFIGLKFHPTIQNLELSNGNYTDYMKFAEKNKIPCLFHCAVSVDSNGKLSPSLEVSDPKAIHDLAKKFKETPVVMAHLGAGWNESHDKAIEVLKDSIKNSDSNLYADISWVDIDSKNEVSGHKTKEHIIKAIKTLKGIGDPDWKYGDQSFRLMFGTDAPIDRFSTPEKIKHYTDFVEDIKFAIKNDPDLKQNAEKTIDDLFYNNAKRLYLDNKNKPLTKTNKFSIPIIIGVTALAVGTGYYLYKRKKNHNLNA